MDAKRGGFYQNYIEMPGVLQVLDGLWRAVSPKWAQTPFVGLCYFKPSLLHFLAVRELDYSQRGLWIGKIVFVSRLGDFVTPAAFCRVSLPRVTAHPMRSHQSNAICQRGVVCGHHSTLARCQRLGCIKTERGHRTQRPNVLSLVLCGNRVGSIFNHS